MVGVVVVYFQFSVFVFVGYCLSQFDFRSRVCLLYIEIQYHILHGIFIKPVIDVGKALNVMLLSPE